MTRLASTACRLTSECHTFVEKKPTKRRMAHIRARRSRHGRQRTSPNIFSIPALNSPTATFSGSRKSLEKSCSAWTRARCLSRPSIWARWGDASRLGTKSRLCRKKLGATKFPRGEQRQLLRVKLVQKALEEEAVRIPPPLPVQIAHRLSRPVTSPRFRPQKPHLPRTSHHPLLI